MSDPFAEFDFDVRMRALKKTVQAQGQAVEENAARLAAMPTALQDGVQVKVRTHSYKMDQGITTHKYVSSSGAVTTNTYAINDIYIAAVTAGEVIRILKTVLLANPAYSQYAFFSDLALTSLIFVAPGTNETTLDAAVTVPAGASYVAVNYSSQNSETEPEVYRTRAFDPQSISAIAGKIKAAEGARVWVFGDSQPTLMRRVIPTTQGMLDVQDWDTLKEELGAEALLNFSIIGATIHDQGDSDTSYPSAAGTEYLSNLFRWAMRVYGAHTIGAPDVVVLWMGGNSSYSTLVSGLTNFDTVMGLSYEDLISAAYSSTRDTINGGLRYWFESVKRTFPYAKIVVITPLQTSVGSAITYTNISAVRDALIKMAKVYSAQVINAMDEINISYLFEVANSPGIYFSDGLHVSPAQRAYVRKFIAKRLEAALQV